MTKALQIAREVLAAVGGKENVSANDLCMTRLRMVTKDPSLVDAEQLTSTSGVLGILRRGSNGVEVVFGPGKAEGIHEAMADLTGIHSPSEPFAASDAAASPMQVMVNKKQARRDEPGEPDTGEGADDDLAEVESLLSILEEDEGAGEGEKPTAEPQPTPRWSAGDPDDAEGARLLVINGPNINMLGIREPGIYGTENYAALLQLCQDSAAEAGFSRCTCFQSNHEGDLVDAIQDAYENYDAIVINPGAYTHTSIAILDAAKAVQKPMVEVHISKVDEREDFRQVSYIRAACFETITGLGIAGYKKAIFDLAEKLEL